MDTSGITHNYQAGVLWMAVDQSPFNGDLIAVLVDVAQRVTAGQAVLHSLDATRSKLVWTGPMGALELLQDQLRRGVRVSALNGRVPAMQLERMPVRGIVSASSQPLVLLVDGDEARAKADAEVLGRAEMNVCIASGGRAAQTIMQTTVPFDAIVMRHRLNDIDAQMVLDTVPIDKRVCSTLVIDERFDASRSLGYRALGAHRYVPQPTGPLQLIGRVNATIVDSQAWRETEPGTGTTAPPRLHLDPAHAADRLKHVFTLSSTEREVAYWVLMGLRDLDIADRLRKSERTAKRHVGRVLEKAGIQNRASLWAVLHHDGRGESPQRAREVEVVPTFDPAPPAPVVMPSMSHRVEPSGTVSPPP
ncbi:MAG: LuxR C-terminal-related transcriptional regulator [Myxococcota bacterium]